MLSIHIGPAGLNAYCEKVYKMQAAVRSHITVHRWHSADLVRKLHSWISADLVPAGRSWAGVWGRLVCVFLIGMVPVQQGPN